MASSSGPNGVQRSRSSCNIPVAHRLSTQPLVGSTSKGSSSVQKSRSRSVVRHAQGKKLFFDKNMARSSSNLNVNDLPQGTHLSRQGSGSLLRLTTNTPQSIRSGRKSPIFSSTKKDNRPVSDRRWQYEQIVKVRTFLSKEFPHSQLHDNVKSGMSLEMFVVVMDSLFKLIDRRIKITRENYVEEVPSNLKRYRYPTNIKPSLMKTVNTPHSWPHVVAILAWLTDIINEINFQVDNKTELENLADNCCMELYRQWNTYADESTIEIDDPLKELDLKLVDMYDLDDVELKKLESEIEAFNTEITAYKEKNKNARTKLDELELNISSLNEMCDKYLTENQSQESNLRKQFAQTIEKIKAIDQELSDFSTLEHEIKSIIASQPYSHTQYQQLSQEIKDLQNTTKLKEERCEQHRELIFKYDLQLSDVKQKVEESAYKYNNMISQLELYNPALNKLRVRESGFARSDTENEIEKVLEMLKKTIKSLTLQHGEYVKAIEEFKKKQKEFDLQITSSKKELGELLKAEAEMEITLKLKNDKNIKEIERRKAELYKYQTKLKDAESRRCNLDPYKEELQQNEERKTELLKYREDLKETALRFFVELDSQINKNMQYYCSVMEDITSATISAQEKIISDAQDREELLRKAEEEVESLLKDNLK